MGGMAGVAAGQMDPGGIWGAPGFLLLSPPGSLWVSGCFAPGAPSTSHGELGHLPCKAHPCVHSSTGAGLARNCPSGHPGRPRGKMADKGEEPFRDVWGWGADSWLCTWGSLLEVLGDEPKSTASREGPALPSGHSAGVKGTR